MRSADAFLCGVVCLLVEDALVLAIGSSVVMEQTAAEEQALIPDGSPPRFGVAHRGEAHLCGVEAPPAMTQFRGVEAPRGVAGRCCITMAMRGVPRTAVCGVGSGGLRDDSGGCKGSAAATAWSDGQD